MVCAQPPKHTSGRRDLADHPHVSHVRYKRCLLTFRINPLQHRLQLDRRQERTQGVALLHSTLGHDGRSALWGPHNVQGRFIPVRPLHHRQQSRCRLLHRSKRRIPVNAVEIMA